MELEFEVYNNRHGQTATYRIKKTQTGWYISYIAINGDCEPNGEPFLYSNFRQDYIGYPSSLPQFFEELWERIDTNDIDAQEAQIRVQQLADWVSSCEMNEPKWQGYNV